MAGCVSGGRGGGAGRATGGPPGDEGAGLRGITAQPTFSHRLTVHEYKKSTLHLSYFSKDIRSPGTFASSSLCLSVSQSVCPFQVLFSILLLFFFGNLGSLTLTLPGIYRIVRTYRYGSTGMYVRISG